MCEAVKLFIACTQYFFFRGKVLVIVNVASQCGLTNANYTQLKELLDKYKPQGLEVAAFPCNQFGGQVGKHFSEGYCLALNLWFVTANTLKHVRAMDKCRSRIVSMYFESYSKVKKGKVRKMVHHLRLPNCATVLLLFTQLVHFSSIFHDWKCTRTEPLS